MDTVLEVVKRESIPSMLAVEQDGASHSIGEFRDFRWNEELRSFLSDASDFAMSWAVLPHREVLPAHVHPIQSMMIVYRGTGEVFGDLCRPLSAGEVLVVPAGCSHGFIGGPEGLHVVTMQLGRGFYTNRAQPPRVSFLNDVNSRQALLAFNEKRVDEFKRQPIFELLTGDALKVPEKRRVYLSAMQIWIDGALQMFIARQAGCTNPRMQEHFVKELQSELNGKYVNGSLDANRCGGLALHDARMEAFTSWFAYQMYVLDDIEKAAISHLVIEEANGALEAGARPVLEPYVGAEYFSAHRRRAAYRGDVAELLRQESAGTYVRLRRVVAEAWSMIYAMSERVVALTDAA